MGGICGFIKNGTIMDCTHEGIVSDTMTNAGSVFFCFCSIGGVAGEAKSSTIKQCGNSGNVVMYNTYYNNDGFAGGRDAILNCGGVVGRISSSSVLLCYNKGDILIRGLYVQESGNHQGLTPCISGVASVDKTANCNNSIEYCYNIL